MRANIRTQDQKLIGLMSDHTERPMDTDFELNTDENSELLQDKTRYKGSANNAEKLNSCKAQWIRKQSDDLSALEKCNNRPKYKERTNLLDELQKLRSGNFPFDNVDKKSHGSINYTVERIKDAYKESRRLFSAFIRLEKAYDRIPREVYFGV